MGPYLMRRLLLAIPTIFGVTVLIFLAMRVIPGDPLRSIIGEGQIYVLSDEELASVKASLGYDRPLVIQYLAWMGDVAKGNLGYSFWQRDRSIADMVIRRGPITLQISIMALMLAWIIGLPAGIVTAMWRNTPLDYVVRGLVTLLMAIPNFWLGLAMILATILIWNWRPPVELVSLWDSPWTNLQMTIGPAIAMGTGFGAIIARMIRSSMLEVLREDYVRTAQAKGLQSSTIIVRHALRNALLPTITLSGLYLGATLGGAVAVERAFSVPGLGYSLIYAVQARDWTVIQSLVLLFAVAYVIINLVVDIIYGLIDPRIRY
ncbi:MAG: ABC transporter permease [Chloroflexi bacterium]|nr:ABC transporter permease [Chloroflexota bacterium]